MDAEPNSSDLPVPERAAVETLLAGHWEADAAISRLPGENLNLLVRSGDGRASVLKITTDDSADVELEEAILDTLDAAGIPVPSVIPDRAGERIVRFVLDGVDAFARMQRHLPGDAWRDVAATPELGRSIGRMLAEVHAALAGFDHAGADRSHAWDIATCRRHRGSLIHVEVESRRTILEMIMQEQAAIVEPLLERCPRGMLHGDANDENILVDGERVAGLIDFGDALRGALVQDLGITLAYAAQHGTPPNLDLAASVVVGYHEFRPLQEEERRALFPLLRSRLATSALIGAARRAESPEHATWYSHEETTWRTLEALASFTPEAGRSILCAGIESRRPHDPTNDASVLSRRRVATGANLSLSYDEPLHIVEGRGPYLIAANGRPYLDLVNNVCHVGHSHPRVVEAISTQAATLNTNTRYLHEGFVEYAGMLASCLPDPLDTVFLVNSGSEANELALRIARAATGAKDALVIDGAYHGHAGNCVEMSPYKFDGPGGGGRPDWVHVAPVPDRYRGLIRGDGDDVGAAYALELATTIGEACASGRSIAAFFVEPILSCGGQIPLPSGYLAAAFKHVRNAGGLCVADEVQVGFGRVGDAFWGFELDGADGGDAVVPDIVVMGKPIGNGHPMGAVVTTRAIADAFANGMEFFSTFGGNPVSCAVGRAVLEVIDDEGLQSHAATLGKRFLEGLRDLQSRHESIGDVRGRGLFLGIEFVRDRTGRAPAADVADTVAQSMKRNGVLLSTDGPEHNVIKIKPPMVIETEDVEMTIRLLDDVLRTMTA
ncbi:MAG: aminotransferase class III-fold pyridoxal phosphate-dependent enzyme [Phycisphaera sp.]|nr:aminotransferase class III-fold pyridoxal phosphate-dependent enzyme [Phycisphaera sp.]